MLLLLYICQGTVTAGFDIGQVIEDLVPSLGGSTYADLVFWDEEELYQLADEAAKRMARAAGVFAVRDVSTVVAEGTADYPVPARHLSTVHVSIDQGAGFTPLREATVEELEALDAGWRASPGSIERYVQDRGTENLRLYHSPAAGGTLGVICHEWRPEITPANRILAAPLVLADYIALAVLAEARRKESEAAMPEIAGHLDERLALIEAVMREYWGQVQ
jgi:hypothetical protein